MSPLLGLDLRGRRVVVAGGGPAAAGYALAFADDGADLLIVAPALCEDLRDLVAAGRASWREGDCTADDFADAWLAAAATGESRLDAAVAAAANGARIWCIGGSARAAATATQAGVRVGALSTAVDEDRDRRVLAGLLAAIRTGRADLRRRRAAGGSVVLVGGGPGAPDLITVRGMQALRTADVVVTDRLGPTDLLAELPPTVEIVDVGKTPGHHPVPQDAINRILVEHAQAGRRVVRLKGGDPFVLGRGGEEVLACLDAGVGVEVVPGITSAVAVPAAAGIPVTHRGTATAFHVITGHEGLTPAVAQGLRAGSVTVVVLMGVAALPDLVASALAAGADPQTPVAIIERGCTPQQRVVRTTLAAAPAAAVLHDVQAPAVIVIGAVAALALTQVGDGGIR